MVLMAMLAIEVGFLLGRGNREKVQSEQARPISTVVGAVLALPLTLATGSFIDPRPPWGVPDAALLEDDPGVLERINPAAHQPPPPLSKAEGPPAT